MSKRFHATQVNPFKITDNWLHHELISVHGVVDTMNEQEERIQLLQKANENISRASHEISDILENGGVILTKEQLNEIINEGAYRKKVNETLQEINKKINGPLIVGASPRQGNVMNRVVQQGCYFLLTQIAKELEVELK